MADGRGSIQRRAFMLRIPSYAATAFHHGLGLCGQVASADEAYRQDERFLADFAGVLAGSSSGPDRARATTVLSGLIGVSAAFLADCDLRVAPDEFAREQLRGRRLVVGMMDSRVAGFASLTPASEGDDVSIDAAYAPIREASYEVFSHAAYGAWQWNRGGATGNQFSATGGDLARALRRNPAMRLWACSGRYDLVTPTTSVDWSLSRLDIAPEARAAIHHEVLESGHMPYTCDLAHGRMMAALHDSLARAGREKEST